MTSSGGYIMAVFANPSAFIWNYFFYLKKMKFYIKDFFSKWKTLFFVQC